MKVRMFGGGVEEFGAIRYEIEWITIKPSAGHKDSIDPDNDTTPIMNIALIRLSPCSAPRNYLIPLTICVGT